jgi:glycosyltransferase involved in cell wall biosynthesis
MSNKKIKVFFIIPNLMQGGAEKIITFLAMNISTAEFEPKLIVIGNKNNSVFEYDPTKTVFLEKRRVQLSIFLLLKIFISEKPKIVFSTLNHLNTFLSLVLAFFPKITFISREATIHSASVKYGGKHFLIDIFQKFYHYRVDKIICQSIDMKNDLDTTFGINEKTVVIGNPITCEKIYQKNLINDDRLKIITIGRLDKIKGHERIFRILKDLDSTLDFFYTIIGDGPEKEYLINLSKELGIFEKIRFIDFVPNPNIYVVNNHFFLQGSYSEGFPNAALDSIVNEIPVISFKIKGGINQIIYGKKNGYLVDSPEEFLEILRNFEKSTILDWEFSNSMLIRNFGKEKILSEYENIFKIISSKKNC